MHVDELAELYALGQLDALERAQVTEHVAHCAPCLRRVGEAEETVFALERVAEPVSPYGSVTLLQRRRASWGWPALAAAALVLGLLLPRALPVPQNPALLAMIHSHFSHAQFSGAAGAPAAKVIYARDRSWLYVIVEGTGRYTVRGFDGHQTVTIGTTQSSGTTSELYARPTRRLQSIELREGTLTIETATMR